MADFTINIPASPDSDDHVMLLTAVLEGSVATITNTTTGKVEVQPWKPLGDGTRTDWENEEEVITWYKELNQNG
jgi:hypothetical protein